MKHLVVHFSDRMWIVPVKHIAQHRAEYYAKADPDTTYEQEFDYCMDDDCELLDWANNNMDWEELEHHAEPHWIEPPRPDHNMEWVGAEKEIITDG